MQPLKAQNGYILRKLGKEWPPATPDYAYG